MLIMSNSWIVYPHTHVRLQKQFAAQFSPLVDSIIAHESWLRSRLSFGYDVWHFRAIFTLFLSSIVPHSGFTREMRLYITQHPVFASVRINTEKDQKLQKTHFVCFNAVHQWRTLRLIFINTKRTVFSELPRRTGRGHIWPLDIIPYVLMAMRLKHNFCVYFH